MLHVYASADETHHVTWTGLATGPFVLERAEALNGPWEALYTGTATQYLATLPAPPSIYQRWYYRLTDAAATVYGPTSVQIGADRVARYVIWHANRQLQRTGMESYLFTERQEGEPCPTCWDPISERRTRGNCPDCDGSGKLFGWPEPIPFWMSYGIEEPQPIPTGGETKSVQLLQVEAWTSSFPLIKTGDYVVRAADRRVYDVLRWQPTKKGAFLIRQTVTLRLAERDATARELASLIVYDPTPLQDQTVPGNPLTPFENAVRTIVEDELANVHPPQLPSTGTLEGGTIDG